MGNPGHAFLLLWSLSFLCIVSGNVVDAMVRAGFLRLIPDCLNVTTNSSATCIAQVCRWNDAHVAALANDSVISVLVGKLDSCDDYGQKYIAKVLGIFCKKDKSYLEAVVRCHALPKLEGLQNSANVNVKTAARTTLDI